MNTRTKWLLAGVGVLALLYVGDYVYRTYIEEPSRNATVALEKLDKQLQDAADSQLIAKKISQKMEGFAGRALPYNPDVARSLYQDWLLKLMERHEMAGISIDASAPVPIEIKSRTTKKKNRLIGYRISYSVHGKTSLPKWVNWVRDFESSGHLHKIKSLTLIPLGNGNEIDANLTIEAVSLQAAEREDQLTQWIRNPQQEPSASVLASFVQRNIFARGFSKTLAAIRLQALTFNRRGEGEAWFDVGEGKSTQIINLGQKLDIPIRDIVLLSVAGDVAKLKVNGAVIELAIGQTLGQVMDPGTNAAPESPAGETIVEESDTKATEKTAAVLTEEKTP
ncbi:MAG: hypothetical protein J0M26_13625 [Planctomycetes bacterium]|nr:hypothetical protein [Planctomycetota bacterium]